MASTGLVSANPKEERRQSIPPLRIPLQLPVELFCRSNDASVAAFGIAGKNRSAQVQAVLNMALNLSVGGMFIKTSNYVKPGTKVHVAFSLSGTEKIETDARVVWATEGIAGNVASFAQGIGIEFINLAPRAKSQINNLSAQYHEFP